MSNKLPKYTQVRTCMLPKGDRFKTNKFIEKSTNARLSAIKACAKKTPSGTSSRSTSQGNFRGTGMTGGFAPVSSASNRTSTLGNLVCSCTKKK
jgi:hypothetical protein